VKKILAEMLSALPNPSENSNFARELASIIRSDHIITCSDYEQMLLQEKYKVNNVGLSTFFYLSGEIAENDKKLYNFSDRKNFVWIGIKNFLFQ
jgi:hypothetical protein